MYSRSYYPENEEAMSLPSNYDGTAFVEPKEAEESEITKVSTEEDREVSAQSFSAITKLPLLSGLFGGEGLRGLSLSNLGTEELLIIAVAAFLFFSKEGDKECALILLFLLFVG